MFWHREWFQRGALTDLLGEDAGLAEIHKLYRFDVIKGFLSSVDELQQALAIIQRDFDQLTSFIAAEDKLARMRDIDTGINPALAVFQQLPETLASLPSLGQEFILSQI